MCAFSTYNVWSTWKNDPIIVDTESKRIPVINIPFPAITICPFCVFASNKFNYTAAHRLLLKFDGNSSRDLNAAEYVEFNWFHWHLPSCSFSLKCNSILDWNWRNWPLNFVSIASYPLWQTISLMNIWTMTHGIQSMKMYQRSMKHLFFVNCSANGLIVANCLFREQLNEVYAIHSIHWMHMICLQMSKRYFNLEYIIHSWWGGFE